MRTIKFKMLTVIFLAIMVLSCKSESTKEKVALESVEVTESYNSVTNDNVGNNSNEKQELEVVETLKIIKSANVKYKVKNVKVATKKVVKIVKGLRGYISDQRFQNTNYQIENRFTIKVPQKQFDTLLDSLGTVAEFIEYENITSKDVTEEYVDIKARLETKEAIKKRYEDILRKRATKVEDILAAEEKIGLIQEEIESAKGRLNYLSNKVSFSTIQVDLYETVNYKEEPTNYKRTFFSKMKEGFSFGWNLIEKVFLGVIYLWPILLIATFIILYFKRRNK